MTDKATITRIMEMTVTLSALDTLLRRMSESMLEPEYNAVITAAGIIDGLRAEAMIETGVFTVDDFAPLADDAGEPDEEPEEQPDPEPMLEKARVALKTKPSKK